ncbi:hypothetical protein C1645_816061 [Glomus cerebriforme]|uniref:RAD51 interacting motif domain-containing protein n=1 Tax=Glomus cerebriforme TaxID=658196 RepID=A0A397TF03_9GLOM|nr:hypothetical protein C1645_816061 [Glomus cerebriforme]
MESVRRSTRKRKCVDYNDNQAGNVDKSDSLDCDSFQGSPSYISTQKTHSNGENIVLSEHTQTKKKKKLSLSKKSGTSNKDNKEKEQCGKSSKFEGAQEVNMVVIVEPMPIKDGAKGDDLFNDSELSDPPDLDKDLKSEIDLETKKAVAKLNYDTDDDTFAFDDTDDGSDYEEGCKNISKKKNLNTGKKAKPTPAKENGRVKKDKEKKQSVSKTNTSAQSTKKTASQALGGLKRKVIGESKPLTPKFTSGPLNKVPSSGLSRKLKVKSLHPYLKKQ